MPVTIRDVALAARVSRATVSRVLTGKPYVSEEVRARVLAAVEALGYQPSRVARSLRAQRAAIIGLIISDIQNPFYTALVRAVEDVASAHGYALFLCNSDEDIAKETLYIDLMRSERVAGVVITPTRETDNPCKRLLEASIPVVSVDRRMLDLSVDTVIIDNSGAAYDLVSHLIRSGHRRIASVVGQQTISTSRERHEGYVRALEAHGLPVLPELVQIGSPKEDFGYRATLRLLDLPEPPTALFLANNLLTLGALKAIVERGLRVPEDIALGAFDRTHWTPFQPVQIVVAQPTYELGRTAASLLLQRIVDRTRPVQEIVLEASLLQNHVSFGQRGMEIEKGGRHDATGTSLNHSSVRDMTTTREEKHHGKATEST